MDYLVTIGPLTLHDNLCIGQHPCLLFHCIFIIYCQDRYFIHYTGSLYHPVHDHDISCIWTTVQGGDTRLDQVELWQTVCMTQEKGNGT